MFLCKKDVLKIYYYLIAVDGKVSPKEIEKFEEFGKEMDGSGEFKNKFEIITECQYQINKAFNARENYEVIQAGVRDALTKSMDYLLEFEKKQILWNLLTLAECDGTYSENEKKLIHFIRDKLGIEKTIYMEMENAIKAIISVKREIEWAKTTNKPYVEIEKLIRELNKRKTYILKSIQFLIKD